MAGGGPPDFIGVGTHLSGTAWLYGHLLSHPGIVGPANAERSLHFFDRFCIEELTEADVVRYHECFPRARGEISGEYTPRYLYDVWTLPLLRRAAPEAKLIVIVRDPIERFRSALTYRLRNAAADASGDATYMTDALYRGRYASQLRALHAFFPREQVLVLQYERCRLDPVGQIRRTLEFLGADPNWVPRPYRRLARGKTGPILPVRILRALGVPETLNRERLLGAEEREDPAELWPDLLTALHDALDAEMVALRDEFVPDLDLALWPNFEQLAG